MTTMTLACMTPAAVKRGTGSVTRTFVDLAEGWEAAIAVAKRVTAQQRRTKRVSMCFWSVMKHRPRISGG